MELNSEQIGWRYNNLNNQKLFSTDLKNTYCLRLVLIFAISRDIKRRHSQLKSYNL